jgi:hypothetical protein
MSQELEERLEQATFLLREVFPHYMSCMSEEIFCAGWLINLDVELPTVDPIVDMIATFLKEIPLYTDNTWRSYPSALEIKRKSSLDGYEQLELELEYAA